MFKKFLSVIMAIAITLSLSSPAFASDDNSQKNNDFIKTSSGEVVSKNEVKKYINSTSDFDKDLINSILNDVNNNLLNKNNNNSNLYNVPMSTSDTGAAWDYTSVTTTKINCYGYASRFNAFLNPGDLYYSSGSPIGRGQKADVNTVAKYVLNDLSKANRSSRLINSATAPINSNEYRIALRVGYQQGMYDYHFMLQCSDGGWCHKPGQTPSQYLGMINPSTYSWDLGTYIKNFYNSDTIYIAVVK